MTCSEHALTKFPFVPVCDRNEPKSSPHNPSRSFPTVSLFHSGRLSRRLRMSSVASVSQIHLHVQLQMISCMLHVARSDSGHVGAAADPFEIVIANLVMTTRVKRGYTPHHLALAFYPLHPVGQALITTSPALTVQDAPLAGTKRWRKC